MHDCKHGNVVLLLAFTSLYIGFKDPGIQNQRSQSSKLGKLLFAIYVPLTMRLATKNVRNK
jgi:hypothetical protein